MTFDTAISGHFWLAPRQKKVKPKVELRGSIMALSNTGGR